jgi:hypothetical protein
MSSRKSLLFSVFTVETQLNASALTLARSYSRVAAHELQRRVFGEFGAAQFLQEASRARAKELSMKSRSLVSKALIGMVVLVPAVAILGGASPTPKPSPQTVSVGGPCTHVGGAIITNFGAIDQNTTMGTATGNLRGAVSGTILGTPQPGAENTLVFHVQHHWVRNQERHSSSIQRLLRLYHSRKPCSP